MKTMDKSQVQYGPIHEALSGGRAVQNVKLPWEKKFHLLGAKSKEALALWVQKYVDEAFAKKETWQAYIAERRAKDKEDRAKAKEVLKVGDIFVASWDMTRRTWIFTRWSGFSGRWRN